MFEFSKNFVYNTKFFLYQYNYDTFRIVKLKFCREKGFEKIGKKKNCVDSSEIERVSLSRSKRNIRELALCNNFSHFVTFTINSDYCNRYDIDVCEDNLRKLFKSYKRKNPNFAYLFIAEQHEKGGFHFHGLIKGFNKNDLYTNSNGYLSLKHFDVMGFNSISKIKDYNKCCNYITKYITKNCVRNSHNRIFIFSKGLKKADKYEIKPVDIPFTFENDYCSIRDFTCDELCSEEKLYFLKYVIDNKYFL